MEIFKLKLKKTKFKVSENALMKIYNILEKIDSIEDDIEKGSELVFQNLLIKSLFVYYLILL